MWSNKWLTYCLVATGTPSNVKRRQTETLSKWLTFYQEEYMAWEAEEEEEEPEGEEYPEWNGQSIFQDALTGNYLGADF